MSRDDEMTPLDAAEREALAGLRRPAAPSPALYARTVAALHARGALRAPPRQPPGQVRTRSSARASGARRAAAIAGAAAALLLAFVAGRQSTAPAVPAGTPYAFFLLNAPAAQWPIGTTEEQIVEEFREWAVPVARSGRLVLAEEVVAAPLLIDSAGAVSGTRGLDVNGMFVVRVPGADAAAALARTLPHARRGGVVLVQRLGAVQ